MKFRTLLLLFGIFSFFCASFAQGDGIVSSKDDHLGEIPGYADTRITSSGISVENNTNTASLANQQRRVTGRILDSKGEPITGVNITEKGTTNGVISDLSGNFTLNVSSGNVVLVFSFIGYNTQEIPVGSQTTVNVTMVENTMTLEEVVVVGYGSQKKATVTGSISAVTNSTLVQSPVTNLSNAIVGKVSGLLTTQGSGAPGQDQTTMRIRGVGTFAGSTDPLVMVDGIEAQNYNNLDPNEIESISILKDASATAVYGVRGANGVLLITTKRGIIGKPQVTFTSEYAFSTFANMRQQLGSYDYALGFNEALKYDSYLTGVYTPKYTDADIEHFRVGDDPLFHPNTNWIDKMFKKYTPQLQDNLNISGGTENVKYFFSVGYLSQGSMFNDKLYDPGYNTEMKYDRYNFRANFDFKISKGLTAKVNLSSQIEDRRGPSNTGFIMDKIFSPSPTISPGTWDGKIVDLVPNIFYPNPMADNSGTGANYYGRPLSRAYNNYLNGSVRFDYALDFLTQGLSAHGTVSYQNFNSVSTNFSKTLVTYYAIDLGGGKYELAPETYESPFSFSESYGKRRKSDMEFGLDYLRSFGNHNFGGLILYNQSKTFDPGLSYVVPHGFQGVVGRVTYNYNRRYLAEFDFGYNGTENFAPGKRFGFFPAYSVGWVASEEPFFPKNDIVSFVKLRGSYGEVGNDQIGGSRFLYRPTSYTFTSAGGTNGTNTYRWGEVPGTFQTYPKANEGLLGNPLLTWEVAKKLDLGIDLTTLKDHIRITADYFVERRDNILANKGTVPNTLGATLPAYNLGKMKNSGMDAEINYNGTIGKLHYWVKGVVTYTHNVILFMDEAPKPWPYQTSTGKRFGQVFGYVQEGFYNTWQQVNDAMRPVASSNSNKIQPGDFIYKDVNGDGIVDSNDQVPIGYSAFPEQTFGLSFGAEFKGFDISMLFQAATANTHNCSKKFSRGWQDNSGSAVSYLIERSWTPEKYLAGIATDLPHISSSASQGWNYASNNVWQENDNYARLKNIEIGYSMSPTLLKQVGINSVRIFFNGNNLFTWSHLFPGEDPEIPTYNDGDNQPYPIIKTYNTGITVKF